MVVDLVGEDACLLEAVGLRQGGWVWRCGGCDAGPTCVEVEVCGGKQRACRRTECVAGRRKVTFLEKELGEQRRKLATAEARRDREWRVLVENLRDENAKLAGELRSSQWHRATAQISVRRKSEELVGAHEGLKELQEAAEAQIEQCADECMREAAAELERRLAKVEAARAAMQRRLEASEAARLAALASADSMATELAEAKERAAATAKALYNTARREDRARERKSELEEERARPPPNTSAWHCRYSAVSKWFKFFKSVLRTLTWDEDSLAGLGKALYVLGLIDLLWGSKYFDIVYFDNVETLLLEMEQRVFGIDFGLFLHLECHMTLDQIVKLALVTQKAFNGKSYQFRCLLQSEHSASLKLRVPRITPTRSELEPVIKALKASTGFDLADNGRISWRPVMPLISSILEEDCGKCGMPDLGHFLAGNVLDVVISQDATGFGALSIATCVLNNPYSPHSAQNLRILGLGNVDDGREGTTKLLQSNRELLNRLIKTEGAELIDIEVGGVTRKILLNVIVVSDLSSTRKCEKLLNSGHCGCPPAQLRVVHRVPVNEDELRALGKKCFAPNLKQRTILRHRWFEGKVYPCFAPGCTFGRSDQPDVECVVAQQAEKRLKESTVKGAVGRYDKYRLDHAHSHFNVQPGEAGEATYDVNMKTQQVPDTLHGNTLNLPKPWWGHGVLRNASGASYSMP